MPITVSFTTKVPTDWDPDAPLTSAKLNALYDNTEYLAQWLGGSYRAAATPDHIHDGISSALVPIGPNWLRNATFESGTAGWTITQYSGGTVVRSTAVSMSGVASLAFTSTVLANGGGDAASNEYVPVTEDQAYAIIGNVKASVAGVSGKIEIIWYDANKNQISTTVAYTSASLPTVAANIGATITAPDTARYARWKVTGGIPNTGTATGTVYFGGLLWGPHLGGSIAAPGGYAVNGVASVSGNTNNTVPVYFGALRAPRSGIYTTSLNLATSNVLAPVNAQIYVNGVAVGTVRTTQSTTFVNFLENIPVAAGDAIQIYGWTNQGYSCNASLSLLEAAPILPA